MEQLNIPEVTKPMDLNMDLYGGFLKWRTWRTPVNHWFLHDQELGSYLSPAPEKPLFWGTVTFESKYCM